MIMSDLERLTITVTPEMAEMIREAVASGDYASASEAVREALRGWRTSRLESQRALVEMQTFIARGVADQADGRVTDFDPEAIKARGRRSSRRAG